MHQLPLNKVINNYEEEARINFWICLENFKIEFFKPQFDCLIKLLNHISKYQRFQYSYYETRKYRYFRPEKAASKLQMFKYGIEMVIKRIQHNRGQFYVFDLPKKDLEAYEETFVRLFNIYYTNTDNLINEDLLHFKKIIETVDIEKLYSWTTNIVKEIYKKNKIEENKNKGNGLFSKLFGVKKTDIESYNLTKEEEEKIEEILKSSLEEMQINLKTEEKELKFLINFSLESGYFKFSKTLENNNIKQSEGFVFKFGNLDLKLSKCESYVEFEASLKEFFVEMLTVINDQKIFLPISFRSNDDILKFDQIKRKKTNQTSYAKSEVSNLENSVAALAAVVPIEAVLDKKEINNKINNRNLSINLRTSTIKQSSGDDIVVLSNKDLIEYDRPIWKTKFKFYSPGNKLNSDIYLEFVC